MKYFKKFSEFIVENLDKMEKDVIISYDIDSNLPDFRTKIEDLIKKYESEEITQTTFKLVKKMNNQEIDLLIKEIVESYIEFECKDKTTVIKLIQPLANQLIVFNLINKSK